MKLFRVDYLEDDDESYLTVGNDSDTEDSIEERERRLELPVLSSCTRSRGSGRA